VLFNSAPYLLAFLPLSWAAYFCINRLGFLRCAAAFLALASLFFYGWWNPRYVPLIVFSVVFNYLTSAWLNSRPKDFKGRLVLSLGLIFNLGLLAYFKYADFILNNANQLFGQSWPLLHQILPLGISFFTFQKVAYLVDSYRGETKGTGFVHYALFVLFFPQLIAGPIVHHREVLPQFDDARRRRLLPRRAARGLALLALGLFKKTVVADLLAPWARQGFDVLAQPNFTQAWLASLAYSFQLYYDFSGYSDMALGAAALFNIRLPVNFSSPYQSADLLQFWRRWHITLGRFLKDMVYVPMGGNRVKAWRAHFNLFITFLLGGLWHGASWTFVAWGALHGIGQSICRLWQRLGLAIPRLLSIVLTFLFAHIAWVFFRAKSFSAAARMLKAMLPGPGMAKPSFNDLLSLNEIVNSSVHAAFTLLLLLAAAFTAFALPNSNALTRRMPLNWKSALWVASLFAFSLLQMNRPSEFLYFNF
jgi:D-alanyl-lipoteichoic acid acyltransferase DltB (MBOAT superfamily)